jgi:glycosyltransferase involved in cell wall biosynthesis
MQISCVICTHNPWKDFLQRTLEGLRLQTLPSDQWELLVIDNASDTPVEPGLLSWHPRGRVVREDRLGLTNARTRGIEESSGEVILFVDDDNILREDYLEQVLRIHARLPVLGCFGAAVIEPEYEVQPAAEMRPFMSMLALRSATASHWSNDPTDAFTPWGAGMVVTRRVAEAEAASVRTNPLNEHLDRKGTALNSCGDDEFSWVACAMGDGRGIFTELRLTHLIPKGRIQKEYLLRLAEGGAYSRTLLWHMHKQDRSVVRPLASISQLARLACARDGRKLGTEVMQYIRFMSMDSTRREFRRATWQGMQRARQVISSGTVPGDEARPAQ